MTSGSGDGPRGDRPSRPASPGRTRTSHDLSLRLAEGMILAGRYRIHELIGVGAMGLVYRASDEQLETEVAVKVLRTEMAQDPRLLDRFRRELVLARQVTHRNAVRIHDIGSDGDLVFLTMDYVAGRSLREILDRDGPLPPERAKEIVRQLASALEAAHDQGVVHRDLKPENVLIAESGEAFITDFGVARSVTTAGLTRAGAVVGTLDYLSPEQARSDEVDGRSDLYALGIVLFEMLSGELPFTGGSHEEVLAQRLSAKPRALRQLGIAVPPHLQRMIDRCLERDPSRRYASAAELLSELSDSPSASTVSRWLRPAAVGLGVALLLGLSWWAIQRGTWRPTTSTAGDLELAQHAVAVLPLADETGRAEWAWLAPGVAEMLTAALAESPELRVVETPRVVSTVEGLRLDSASLGPNDLRQLADVLSVDRLVTGRVRSLDPGVRVDLTLTTAGTDEVASESVEAVAPDARRVPKLVEDLVVALRGALEVKPLIRARQPPPDDPEAIRALSLGTTLLGQGDAVQARPALEQTVELAPGHAPAWLRLAQAYDALGLYEQAVDAADRAVAGFADSDSRAALEARALDARLGGDQERALQILQRLLERFPNDSEARVALAEVHGDQGDLAAARAALDEVVERDPLHPRAWYLLGKYTIMAGDSRAAIDEHLVHALVVQNKLKNRQGQADVLNAMGVAYHRLDQLDQAAEHYGRAADIRHEIGDERGYATSLRNVAMVDTVRGRFVDAERHLETARQILEQIGDKAGAAGLLTDLGVLAEERGDSVGALESFRRALQLNEEVGDRVAIAETYNNVGYAYYLLGEYDNAGVYWHQAADVYEAVGDGAGGVQVTQNLALVDLAAGNWNQAAAAFLETLESSRRMEMVVAEAVSLGALGELALLRGRFGSARESIDAALALVEQIEDPRGIAEFSLLKGELELALGRPEEGATLVEEAEGWLEDSANREQQAVAAILRGNLALARGEVRSAGEFFERAKEVGGGRGGAVTLEAELGLARAALAAGDVGHAVGRLTTLLDDVEQLGNLPLILEVEETLAGARLRDGELGAAAAVARRALQRVKDAGGYGRAFRLSLILAMSLDRQQQGSGAAALRDARDELDRLRSDIATDYRAAFDSRPEVREMLAAAESMREVG